MPKVYPSQCVFPRMLLKAEATSGRNSTLQILATKHATCIYRKLWWMDACPQACLKAPKGSQRVWSRHFSCGVTLKYHSKNERTIGFINHSLQNVHGFHHWLLTPEHCSGLRCDFQPDRSRHFEPVHLPRSFDAKPNTVTFQVWNLVCLVDLIFPWTEFF